MPFGRKKSMGTAVNQANVAMLATKALAEARSIRVRLGVRVVFRAPGILMHRWTQKAIIQMVGKFVGMDMPRTNKDLTKEYEASWYRNENGVPAIPCRLLKACIVEGAIGTGNVVSKASLNRSLRVLGHTAPIQLNGTKVEMDIRIAGNTNGSPDMRARGVVQGGTSTSFVLEFSPNELTPDKVMAALQCAGDMIGLCDFRPQRGGDYGCFDVKEVYGEKKDIDRIIRECGVAEDVYVVPPEMLRAFNAIPDEQLTDTGRKAKAVVNHVNGSQRSTSA